MQRLHQRVLFVDDEPSIRATLPVILRRYGFEVSTAGTVADALSALKAGKFDLLLCDLNLQREADGYVVIRAMRELNPRCVNIILTAYPGLESAIEAIHHQVDDYIIKPTNPDTLVALLADKLAKRKPKARILSVSYDVTLLRTRQMLLEAEGYEVTSSATFAETLKYCQTGGFDIFVLGHSIPYEEKVRMVETLRQVCPARIISLRTNAGQQPVDGADYDVSPDPEPLLKLIADVTRPDAKSSSRSTQS